jgi:hypothetical protein
LRKVILQRHGNNAPSTYRRNTKEVPIDGIWASLGIEIKAGGYLDFDEVVTGTDHRTLWVDSSYKNAFGYDGSAHIVRPAARRLNQNPNIRDNFNKLRRQCAEKCFLIERVIALESSFDGELSAWQIKEYEQIDKIRQHHLNYAEKHYRKLRKGNIPYSDILQEARCKVEGWTLLLQYKKGLKVSSRKLCRTLKKHQSLQIIEKAQSSR